MQSPAMNSRWQQRPGEGRRQRLSGGGGGSGAISHSLGALFMGILVLEDPGGSDSPTVGPGESQGGVAP